MTQTQDPIQQALGYMRYQGAKSFDDIDALMERSALDWEGALAEWSEEQAAFKPGEEWCAKEVLGHVLLSNRGINQQIAEMAGVESPRPSARVSAMGQTAEEYESLSLEEARKALRESWDETKTLLRTIQSSDRLGETFPHPLFGPLNLKEWFAFHRVHAMDHIQQLDKIKGYPKA